MLNILAEFFRGDSMILVTLGTQDKPFNRLLDAVQKQIDNGVITDKVVVQAGYTKYERESDSSCKIKKVWRTYK